MTKEKAIEKIVAKTGYSVSHVKAVIAGNRNNSTILNLFAQLTAPKASKGYKRGTVTSIAYRTGYSASHVSAVLNGKRNNKTISAMAKTYKKR